MNNTKQVEVIGKAEWGTEQNKEKQRGMTNREMGDG